MATKFKMLQEAQHALENKQKQREQLVESLMILHDNDAVRVQACMEGVVELMSNVVARMNAGKSPFHNIDDPRQQRILLGIISGAKTLMDHPDAAEAHNLTHNRLQNVIKQAGTDINATKALLQVAKSAPSDTKEIVKLFQQYNHGIQNNDEQAVLNAKKQIHRIWYHWQQQLTKPAVDTTPGM